MDKATQFVNNNIRKMARCCNTTSRIVLICISLLMWVASAGLILVGAYMFADYSHYNKLTEGIHTAVLPAVIILSAGIVLFLLGLIGCAATCKEQKCLVGLFFVLLLLILVGLVTGAVLGYVYRGKMDTTLHEAIQKGLDGYKNSTNDELTIEVDYMQRTLMCCGVYNYSDWKNTTWYAEQRRVNGSNYPDSCCKDTYHCDHKNVSMAYSVGCYEELTTEFKKDFIIIASVAASCAVILLLGLIASCVLICRKRDGVPYATLNDPDGMRV